MEDVDIIWLGVSPLLAVSIALFVNACEPCKAAATAGFPPEIACEVKLSPMEVPTLYKNWPALPISSETALRIWLEVFVL